MRPEKTCDPSPTMRGKAGRLHAEAGEAVGACVGTSNFRESIFERFNAMLKKRRVKPVIGLVETREGRAIRIFEKMIGLRNIGARKTAARAIGRLLGGSL